MKIFIVDIDGTICEHIKNEEGAERMRHAKPFTKVIESVNKLFDEGHFICYFTARTDEHKEATEDWMKEHGVKFHQVIYNKPRRIGKFTEYHFIDDSKVKATMFKGKFTNFVKKKAEIEVFED